MLETLPKKDEDCLSFMGDVKSEVGFWLESWIWPDVDLGRLDCWSASLKLRWEIQMFLLWSILSYIYLECRWYVDNHKVLEWWEMTQQWCIISMWYAHCTYHKEPSFLCSNISIFSIFCFQLTHHACQVYHHMERIYFHWKV